MTDANTATPLIIVEEHHEVFYAWAQAISRGIIAPHGNVLFHVDEHADMGLPRLRTPLASLADLEEVRRFTYSELDISTFIWMAVYHGVTDRIVWFRRAHTWGSYVRPMAIRAANAEATEFDFTAGADANATFDEGWRAIRYAHLTPADPFRSRQPVLLDIDLDYFCSRAFPDFGRQRVEVTRSAYEQFLDDPYHVLRISPGTKVSAEVRGGRFYLVFNDFKPGHVDVTREEIGLRIDAFVNYLVEHGLRASLITVCRSRHSGYLPDEHAEFIEQTLLERLMQWSAYDVQGPSTDWAHCRLSSGEVGSSRT